MELAIVKVDSISSQMLQSDLKVETFSKVVPLVPL